MRLEMNMETGKYNRVKYEVGDVIERKGHPEDLFLITKVTRRGRGQQYHALWEKDSCQCAIMKGRMELLFIFKPYMESTGFYK